MPRIDAAACVAGLLLITSGCSALTGPGSNTDAANSAQHCSPAR